MRSACLLHAHLNFSFAANATYWKYTFIFKDIIWHLVRYHKWQHKRQYMAARSLSQVAAQKTVYGTSLVITSGSTKERVLHLWITL
jgi:hypothetical protein